VQLDDADGPQVADAEKKFQPAPQRVDGVGCGLFGAQCQLEDRPGFGRVLAFGHGAASADTAAAA
jgi:hypothetical protein